MARVEWIRWTRADGAPMERTGRSKLDWMERIGRPCHWLDDRAMEWIGSDGSNRLGDMVGTEWLGSLEMRRAERTGWGELDGQAGWWGPIMERNGQGKLSCMEFHGLVQWLEWGGLARAGSNGSDELGGVVRAERFGWNGLDYGSSLERIGWRGLDRTE